MQSNVRVRPSEVRHRVLEQHSRIRGMLDELEVIARSLLREDRKAGRDALKGSIHTLADALDQHMAFEERWLTEALRHADPWGPERVERFEAEHRQQRRILGLFDSAPEHSESDVQLALTALGFAFLLRKEMEEEERDVLDGDLLSDNPIITSPEPE